MFPEPTAVFPLAPSFAELANTQESPAGKLSTTETSDMSLGPALATFMV